MNASVGAMAGAWGAGAIGEVLDDGGRDSRDTKSTKFTKGTKGTKAK